MSSSHIKKNRKNNFLNNVFHVFSCCLSPADTIENVEIRRPKKSDSAIQCEIEKEIQTVQQNNLFRCDALLDLTQLDDDKTKIFNKDIKSSLDKLDSLITALNSIHQLYTNKSETLTGNTENIYLSEGNTGIDVNLENKEKTKCLVKSKCFTPIDTSSLPIILHKSHSGPSSSNDTNEIIYAQKTSGDTLNNINSLKNNNMQISTNFGHFSTIILENITTIKTDIECLKNLFSNIKGILVNQNDTYIAFAYEGLQNCVGTKSGWLYNTEDFSDAKMSVANFCKFYKLGQPYDKKCKKRKSTLKVN